jgi:hypothetical protein
MSDSFVPLFPGRSGANGESAFAALQPNSAAQKPRATPAPAKSPSVGGDACGAPVITMQHTGDVVSSIRIQCTCGQVVTLNCVY